MILDNILVLDTSVFCYGNICKPVISLLSATLC
jgi:hypothetical protein